MRYDTFTTSSTTSSTNTTGFAFTFGYYRLPPPPSPANPLKQRMLDAMRVLGLEKEAMVEGLKPAYRRLAKEWHPDKGMPEEREERTRKMAEINSAFEFLRDVLRANGVAA